MQQEFLFLTYRATNPNNVIPTVTEIKVILACLDTRRGKSLPGKRTFIFKPKNNSSHSIIFEFLINIILGLFISSIE